MAKNMTKFHKDPCGRCGHRDMHGQVAGCIAVIATSPDRWCDCPTYQAPALVVARPRARTSDPTTSHAAAASLTVDALRASLAAVHSALLSAGPMADVDLVEWYTEAAKGNPGLPRQSQSGIRTRRAELVAGGLVEDTGDRKRLDSGRLAIIWKAVQA